MDEAHSAQFDLKLHFSVSDIVIEEKKVKSQQYISVLRYDKEILLQ